MHDPTVLPEGLPAPIDDGRCLHLRGRSLPEISLACTSGGPRTLNTLAKDARGVVLFFYPRTGVPGQPPSLGYHGEEWDSIPGARGCTPQSCGFRELHEEFRALGVEVYGVSTNTPDHQREFKSRQHVPFEFLSDGDLRLTEALDLPTFAFPVESGGPNTLLQRMAWYCEPAGGALRVRKVWYPVFPPDRNAAVVLAWLRARRKVDVSPACDAERDFVRSLLMKHWLSTTIWSRGKPFEADRIPSLVARLDGQPVGHATYVVEGQECELITISAESRGLGAAASLLDRVEDAAREAGCARVFLTTTNDNLEALAFYQRRGYAIAAVHRGMIDWYRTTQKAIPRVAPNGVPIRDEIELEFPLD